MESEIKKRLARNWFQILQEVICKDIEEFEGKKSIFKIKEWKRNKKRPRK